MIARCSSIAIVCVANSARTRSCTPPKRWNITARWPPSHVEEHVAAAVSKAREPERCQGPPRAPWRYSLRP